MVTLEPNTELFVVEYRLRSEQASVAHMQVTRATHREAAASRTRRRVSVTPPPPGKSYDAVYLKAHTLEEYLRRVPSADISLFVDGYMVPTDQCFTEDARVEANARLNTPENKAKRGEKISKGLHDHHAWKLKEQP